MNWGATITIPVALFALPWLLVAFAILALFRAWFVPRPFHQWEADRRLEEKQAKDDALEANVLLMKANNALLARDDLSITTLQEIRDYIHRHDPPAGGGYP